MDLLDCFKTLGKFTPKASDLMQRQSYQVKTVLEEKGARKKTFLAFKDSLGNPLSRSPLLSYCFRTVLTW